MCILYIIFFIGCKFNKHWIIPGGCVTFVVVMYYRHSYKHNKSVSCWKLQTYGWMIFGLYCTVFSIPNLSQSIQCTTLYIDIPLSFTIMLVFRFHRDLKESRCHSLFIEIFMHFLSITCMRCININLGRISST
jgi:hypothetical protein